MTPSSQPGAGPPVAPSFLRALGAIWLFTWKGHLTRRRLLWLLPFSLLLPFLVWKTVDSPKTWTTRRSSLPMGDARRQLGRAAGRIGMWSTPLTPDQFNNLQDIFEEEYDSAEKEYEAIPSPETSVDQQRALVESCHKRILQRAKSLLDSRQFVQFQSADKVLVSDAEDRIGEPIWNRTAPFYRWLIDFYLFIILPLCCVRGCGGLIRDELHTDTLSFLTTRPVRRGTLVVLKYLSQVACLEVWALIEGSLLIAAGSLRHIPDLASLLPLFLAAQFLAVPAWGALGLFLGQLTKRYLPLAVVYGLIVELGIGDIPTNINTLSMMRHLKTLLSRNPTLESLFQWTGGGVAAPMAALLFGTLLFLSLAAFLFTIREYHPATEIHK